MSLILKILAIITAIFFLLIGLMGFIPFATPDEKLFGLISVNPALNFLHLFTALSAAVAAYSSDKVPFAFFRVFGIAYLFIALLGFLHFGYPILGFIANSYAGNFFHALVGAFFLLAGLIKS